MVILLFKTTDWTPFSPTAAIRRIDIATAEVQTVRSVTMA